MKNLLVVGPPKCGKTTLVQMIADKYPCEIIRGNTIESIIHNVILKERLQENLIIPNNTLFYPTLDDEMIIKIYKQLYRQIQIDLRGKKKLIIIDAHILSFSLLENEFGKEFEIYCLGISDLNTEEFCNYIRLYETLDDFTSYNGYYSLKLLCSSIIKESKLAKHKLKEFPNIKFFDTSGNRREKLDIIFKDIEKNVIQGFK